MKKSIPVLLFVSLILGQGILTACSNQESVVNVEVENISLDKSTTSIKVGETLNLSATITPENPTNKEIAKHTKITTSKLLNCSIELFSLAKSRN